MTFACNLQLIAHARARKSLFDVLQISVKERLILKSLPVQAADKQAGWTTIPGTHHRPIRDTPNATQKRVRQSLNGTSALGNSFS